MSVHVNVNVWVDVPGEPEGRRPFDQVSIGPFGSLSRPEPPMDVTLGNNQFVMIHLHGLNAAKIEGAFKSPPGWQLDATGAGVAKATPSPDGLSCRLEGMGPAGPLGTGTLTASDTDDPTVPPLVFNFTVQAEPISTLSATIDAPTELPAPTTAPVTGAPVTAPAPA